MILKRSSWAVLATLVVIAVSTRPSFGRDVMVVLSSESSAYLEALAGLKEVYGQPVRVINLSREDFRPPRSGSIIVAFGGKASLLAASNYEGTVVYGLAPGLKISPDAHSGRLIEIQTSPSVPVVIQKYKELQPGLHRLGVLWIGDSIADYFTQRGQIEALTDVELVSVRLRTLDDLPGELRNLRGKVDAIWMPPDAALVTPQSFAAVREFCLAQRIAFYVPSDGLVAKGATAAAYASFRDLGRLTGSVLNKASSGNLDGTISVFPDKASLSINVNAAADIGLKIAPDVLRKVDKVIP